MSELVHNTNVAAIVTKLTGDNQQPNIQNYVKAHAQMAQEIEDSIWDVWESRLIDNAVGDQLDLLGSIVGAERGNMVDSDYRVAIKIQIAANNSDGMAKDLIHICILAGCTPVYVQAQPAYFQITVNQNFIALAPALIQAKALGTLGDLIIEVSGTGSLLWASESTATSFWATESGTTGAWCAVTPLV